MKLKFEISPSQNFVVDQNKSFGEKISIIGTKKIGIGHTQEAKMDVRVNIWGIFVHVKFLAERFTQVMDSIPRVGCASGNVWVNNGNQLPVSGVPHKHLSKEA